jgi:hypothetical protein
VVLYFVPLFSRNDGIAFAGRKRRSLRAGGTQLKSKSIEFVAARQALELDEDPATAVPQVQIRFCAVLVLLARFLDALCKPTVDTRAAPEDFREASSAYIHSAECIAGTFRSHRLHFARGITEQQHRFVNLYSDL